MIEKRAYTSFYIMSFTVLIYLLMFLISSCKKGQQENEVQEPFKVESYYPNSGNEGTLVTILGTGFDPSGEHTSVTFSGLRADILSLQKNKIVVRAPKGGKTGAVQVKSGSNQSDIGQYKYQSLSLKEIFPANGSAGAHINIMGQGFSSITDPAEVFINGKKSTVVSASDTLLVVEIPENAGSGTVQVKVNGFESSGPKFYYQAIQSIKPLTGGKGTHVTIKGTGFEKLVSGNTVDFNGKAAKVVEAKEDELIVIAPDGVDSGPVSLTINKQRTTGPDFTVVPLPTIALVTPLSGPAGLEMTIKGTTFSKNKEENQVYINGVNVPVTTATATELKLVLPGNTGSGVVKVSVNDQEVTGPKFYDQNLGIKKVSPENGLGGTEVTITGVGFSTNPADNQVTFNNVPAIVLSATDTKLVVKTPSNLSTGTVKVKVGSLDAAAPAPFLRAGVSTLAGGPGTTILNITSNGSIAADASGNVFAIENEKNRIVKITPNGQVSIFAGSASGQAGLQNGPGNQALFNFSRFSTMVMDEGENLYVADFQNQLIRKVTPQGVVSTFSTRVGYVYSMSIDRAGYIYGMRGFENALRIASNGSFVTLNITTSNYSHRPAFDQAGNLYMSPESYTGYISKYPNRMEGQTPLPVINPWLGNIYETDYRDGIGTNARFNAIKALQVVDGKLLILDSNDAFNIALRQADLQSAEVSTLLKSDRGFKDGNFGTAQVASMADIAVSKDGTVYILDNNNNAIRKIYLK